MSDWIEKAVENMECPYCNKTKVLILNEKLCIGKSWWEEDRLVSKTYSYPNYRYEYEIENWMPPSPPPSSTIDVEREEHEIIGETKNTDYICTYKCRYCGGTVVLEVDVFNTHIFGSNHTDTRFDVENKLMDKKDAKCPKCGKDKAMKLIDMHFTPTKIYETHTPGELCVDGRAFTVYKCKYCGYIEIEQKKYIFSDLDLL